MNYLSNFINYLQATKNLSDKTYKAYSSDLNQFFKFEQNILTPDICAFISYLSNQLRLKDTSIRRKIITLKNYYDFYHLVCSFLFFGFSLFIAISA